MATKNPDQLSEALRHLSALGYRMVLTGPDSDLTSTSTRRFQKDGVVKKLLVQTRTHEEMHRYRVGLMYRSFEEIDDVVIYLEGEGGLYIIPAKKLEEWRQIETTYGVQRNPKGGQWVVNITTQEHAEGHGLKVAGMGRSPNPYPIKEYWHPVQS